MVNAKHNNAQLGLLLLLFFFTNVLKTLSKIYKLTLINQNLHLIQYNYLLQSKKVSLQK